MHQITRASLARRFVNSLIRNPLTHVSNPNVFPQRRIEFGKSLEERSDVRVVVVRFVMSNIHTVHQQLTIIKVKYS